MVFKQLSSLAKAFPAVILIFLLISELPAQSPPVAQLRREFPYAELSASHIDLGTLIRGNPKQAVITLQNTGSHPLLIGAVRSSCGLMIPSWPIAALQPGQQANISFRYDASRLGPFERFITIHTNAFQKTLKVKVTGQVTEAYKDLPQ